MADEKGIVIKFKGESVEFDNTVDKVNNSLKAVKKETQSLNQQLKLDPKNVDLLKQKFDSLKSAETLLSEKLKYFKEDLAQLSKEEIGGKKWATLQKQISETETELRKVQNALNNMPNAPLSVMAKNFEEAEKQLDGIANKLETIGTQLMKVSGVAIGLGTAGIAYNAQIEQYQVALTTLTGSAEEADRVIKGINEDASKSSFGVDALIDANKYLIAAGVNGDESRTVINALGNAIAATGGGNSELQRMAQNLQQIKNVGKASSQDIKQFANAGINIYGLLAETTGKTVDQVKNLDVSYELLTEALMKASEEGGKYYGAMEAQSQTLSGSVQKLKDDFTSLLGELTAELLPVIKEIINYMKQWVQRIKEMDPQQKKMITKIGLVVAAAGPFVLVLAKLVGVFGSVNGGISTFLGWAAKIIGSSGSIVTVLGNIMTAFVNLINPINLVIAILVTLFATNEKFRNGVLNLVKALISNLKPAIDNVKTAFDLLVRIVNIIYELIMKFVNYIINNTNFGQGFINVINQIGKAFQNLTGWVSDALSWFSRLISKAEDYLGIQSKVTASGGAVMSGRGAFSSGGLGIAAGGINLTTEIQVNNTGQPIDTAEIQRWVGIMADQLDNELGRRF